MNSGAARTASARAGRQARERVKWPPAIAQRAQVVGGAWGGQVPPPVTAGVCACAEGVLPPRCRPQSGDVCGARRASPDKCGAAGGRESFGPERLGVPTSGGVGTCSSSSLCHGGRREVVQRSVLVLGPRADDLGPGGRRRPRPQPRGGRPREAGRPWAVAKARARSGRGRGSPRHPQDSRWAASGVVDSGILALEDLWLGGGMTRFL